MPSSLRTTFDTLATSRNPFATDVLVAALKEGNEETRAAAVTGILKRRSTRGGVELIRLFGELTEEMRSAVKHNADALARGIRQSLIDPDPLLRERGLEVVRWLEDFAEMPTLINLLDERSLPDRDAVQAVLRELIARLWDRLHQGNSPAEGAERDGQTPHSVVVREAHRIRQQLLATLDSAVHRFHHHKSQAVIEGLLILGGADDPHVKKFFRDGAEPSRVAAEDILQTGTHPGILTLLVDAMMHNYPYHAVFTAFEKRTDPEFILHVLRTWPRKLTPFQQKNFQAIESVAWLRTDRLDLEFIPAAQQRPLVAFLLSTGLPQEDKFLVLEWLVRHGSPEGRLAATDVLVDLEDDKVQEVIVESLESDEPDVQAWATGQLRAWAIPNAMELLIGRLDSPVPEVRQAARKELGDFSIQRVLELYEHLDPRMCVAVGRLVRKIDPDTIPKLKDEMLSAIRRKRIRAARASLVMGMQNDVIDALLLMARDTDNLVRRTAAETLAHVHLPEAVAGLKELSHDPSARVREAAVEALGTARGAEPMEMKPVGAI